MRARLSFSAFVLLAASACASRPAEVASSPTGPVTLAVTARVIDGSGGPPIENGVVLLAGTRIACVGTPTRCPVPAGVRRMAAPDGTVMPGLIDLHVHARPHYLGWFLAAGITTVRDANNSLADVRKNLAVDDRPRIVWTGPMLDGPNTVMRMFGEDGVLRPSAPALDQAWTLEVTTPEEACAAVGRLAGEGAGFIKLYEQLPPDAYRAAARCASERGLPVMTDLGMHNTRGLDGAEVDALQAMEAGVRSIEHASGYALAYRRLGGDPQTLPFDSGLVERLASETVRHGTALVPTLSVSYGHSDAVTDIAGLPMADRLPEDMRSFFEDGARRRTPEGRERERLTYRLSEAVLRRVHALGGTIGAGSDTPAGTYNLPGGGLHRELELLVAAGLTPLEAIRAATGSAARILGRDDLGVLRPGAVADLVLVEGDPSRDIRHTRRIRAVVQAGRPLDLANGPRPSTSP